VTELWEHDAWELAEGVRRGELKSAELVELFLERVDRFDPELNAFCYFDRDGARARAAEIDAEVARGDDPGPWAGVPMGVKELAQVAGWPDTHASKVYEHDIAARDCTETARLRAAGAVFVGLTTSPEFGAVNWTRSYLHGTTRNPWNPERTPGGSSGGSAAAVAAGMMPICTGSDGGGSIRIPSSYAGLFGFKVSFGRVGVTGAFDNGLTSVPGPICRSVRDAARYVDAIAGPTEIDPTSLPKPPSYEDAILSGSAVGKLAGKRAGWSSTLGFAVCDPDVEKLAYEAAVALCADAGVELVDVDARFPRPGRAWSLISNISGATHYGERIWSRPLDELTPVVRPSYAELRDLPMEAVLRALRRRDELLAAIAEVFEQVDVLLTPTTATTAFVAEGPPPTEIAGQSVGGMGSVPYTAPFNISGMPAVSIPVGCAPDGLPVGLQAVTRRHDEELVLACGAIAEANRPWPKFAPMSYDGARTTP
jgi:aspartyl-tRNA(Asn)/glutamyl-tRNA(Gln) amidotransferase subunit A